MNAEQFIQMTDAPGFIAALDQSGGSTPHALELYGIGPDAYNNDDELFTLMHQMRTRIITSPNFANDRVIAAILFEMTMDRTIDGLGTAEYLWRVKHIVPFLKVDKGLQDEADGVRLMKPMPDLRGLLGRANTHPIFGTKMRSVIHLANAYGIDQIVTQQFDIARKIMAAGLVPIIEPEVDIHSPEKAGAELLLRQALLAELDRLDESQVVILKLTLPDFNDFYADLIAHPQVLRVAALSGGYSREVATYHLARNHAMIASFSRALTEGLRVDQTEDEFDRLLDASIETIYVASCIKETEYVL